MSNVTLGLVSLVVWILLWGDVSPGNVVSGIAVAALLMLVFPNNGPFWPTHSFNPVAMLRFAGYFLGSLFVSNAVLAREVLRRRPRIQTGVVVVAMPDCSPALVRFVANVIALTPGTMAVRTSYEPAEISVHILQMYDIDEARASIEKIRYLAVCAFAAPEIRRRCVRQVEPGGEP